MEEIVKKNSPVVNDTAVKIKKIIGEKLNTTISASVNDSDKEVKKNVEKNENDKVNEIEEVFDEEEGKVDVENIDLMLDNDNVEENHDLILDSVPVNNELKDIISNLSDLTQKCKDNNINNMLVSNPNDIDLTNFLKDSVQNNPHESDKKKQFVQRKKRK